jgi:glyoxylase-like metal-dependent hydrolase (beta-lactamase superfamily II)
MWRMDWEKIETVKYYIWCIRGAQETVIVDTGVSPDLAKERDLTGYTNPAEMLSRIGIEADAVQCVILTHLHWDHASGASLFPKATLYVQEGEYHFWLKDRIASRPPFRDFLDEASKAYLASLEGTDRLCLLKGDQAILPGIECLLAPGHTVALQAVAVNTAKGTAILGSDCAHLFRNYQQDWPSSLIVDLVGWMNSYEKLRAKVASMDLLFPGHDPILSQNYPEVAQGVTRLV